MFTYYLNLAFRNLKESPVITLLMVLVIGLGVATSMTAYSVFRAVSGNPIPWKSSRLYVPQIDMWGPSAQLSGGEPPNALDYADAIKLMQDHRAKFQSAMYQISVTVVPFDASHHPFNISGHAVYSEFFTMLDTPFLYGSGWSSTDDTERTPVAVISRKINQELFGGNNSVGKSIDINDNNYRIVGVMDNWNPQPRFYDLVNSDGFSITTDDVFIPFQQAVAANISNNGTTACNIDPPGSGFSGLQQSTCTWISYMVELDDAETVTRYRQYMDNYARDQQRAGRFAWPPNNRLRNLSEWLDFEQVVPSDTKISLLVAWGLFVVCMVNTTGLLLTKFLRRSGEFGVRRALGAPRKAIYAQLLTEAGMIGGVGGLLGLVLTGFGVASVNWVLPMKIASLAHFDISLLFLTILVALIATTMAGIYPAYRASHIQPAWQLKTN